MLKDKVKIEKWLNNYDIYPYELIEDKKYGYIVNVDNDVNLVGFNLKSIDVKFNRVNGYFNCSCNHLKSLVGCPEIVEGGFYFYSNNLEKKLLEDLPKEIKGNFVDLNNNPDLGELQNVTNFNELKKILKIYKEKKELIEVVEKKLSIENLNTIKNSKLNKI